MATVKLQITGTPPNRLELGDLWLQGDLGVKVNLRRAVTTAVHDQTIDGASTITLTVRDPDRGLLRSNIVKTKATMTLDRVQYRLVRVARDGGQLTLTFETTAVNVLREIDSPKKANRANTTRAQFVKSMVDEIKGYAIPFRCPEQKARQPIASH